MIERYNYKDMERKEEIVMQPTPTPASPQQTPQARHNFPLLIRKSQSQTIAASAVEETRKDYA